MSISRVVAPDIIESSPDNDDTELYSQCRFMLSDMAQAGNPASIDHHALLTDIENIIEGLVAGLEPEDLVTNKPVDTEPPSLDLCEHLWSDADWVKFLNACSQTIE